MRYKVRSPHGQLDFDTFAAVAKAYRQGLVDPEDEVAEAGTDQWRKAGALPELKDVKPDTPSVWSRAQLPSVLFAVVLGLASMYVMARVSLWMGMAMLAGDGLLLMRVAVRAQSKPRT